MTPPTHAPTPTPRPARRAYTMIEVLIAAGITAVAATAAASLIRTAQDVSATADGRANAVAAIRNSLLRLDMTVKQARLLGYYDTSQVLIWTGDTNNNSQINMLELLLVRHNSTNNSLELVDISFPASMSQSTRDALNAVVSLGSFCSPGSLIQAPIAPYVRTRTLAQDVKQCTFWVDGQDGEARLVRMTLQVDRQNQSQTFHAVMAPRVRRMPP